MDVVWLKRDVRLRDHGPLADVERSKNPFLILYLYEPDQLSEPTVHGSHIQVINEGLQDLDNSLSGNRHSSSSAAAPAAAAAAIDTFQCLTVAHTTILGALHAIHQQTPIGRLLSHEETGHYQSFERDKRVRRWCRSNNVLFLEYPQTGVTRCLRNRDDFSKHLNAFLAKPMHATFNYNNNYNNLSRRLITNINIPGRCNTPIHLSDLTEIEKQHRVDREDRQKGGETEALATLDSFLQNRGCAFSSGISSPNSSWTSCSRLSIYLAWGHISLRYVIQSLRRRQDELRRWKRQGKSTTDPRWLRSLSAFSSRLHWRSHFIQKLESAPMMEKRDLCPAYQSLRRQDGDWNQHYFQAWASGKTGFPFVDACMRCLHRHGWINFRMRAMLVSFATYNLWLDWKRIAPHLARSFLDYEPGIHYPQLQMQAGTTGINAMRVYNVTKQGKDQDPSGVFIKKYIPELRAVDLDYIHEPWKMTLSRQKQANVFINDHDIASQIEKEQETQIQQYRYRYPAPIVNEQETARQAKAKVAAVRKLESTKQMAQRVYNQHGSRNRRRDELNGRKPKALSTTTTVPKEKPQQTIRSMFQKLNSGEAKHGTSAKIDTKETTVTDPAGVSLNQSNEISLLGMKRSSSGGDSVVSAEKRRKSTNLGTSWSCNACTFINHKPIALACEVCATARSC